MKKYVIGRQVKCNQKSFMKMKKRKKHKKRKKEKGSVWPKMLQFIGWKFVDLYRLIRYGRQFTEFGITLYCGRQGAGKTIGMVSYLENIRVKYPEAIIVTNFGYKHQTMPFESWQQLFDLRNGTKGVVFAIDELQNEFSSSEWDRFPKGILAQVTMQRKQRIKIIGTSQVFTRVVKALREQCYEVVECKTWLGRWTFLKAFDAEEYNTVIDEPLKKQKLMRTWRKNFIQSDKFRELYDTNLVVERMKQIGESKEEKKEKVAKLIQSL